MSNPFSFAEAIVGVVVDGVSSLGLKEGHRYPLVTDEDESVIWQALHDRILSRYPGQNATLLRMDLAEEVKCVHDSFLLRHKLKLRTILPGGYSSLTVIVNTSMHEFLVSCTECVTRLSFHSVVCPIGKWVFLDRNFRCSVFHC